MSSIPDLLLRLYGLAEECSLGEFQDAALAAFTEYVKFDSARLGVGNAEARLMHAHSFRESPEIAEAYREVSTQDRLLIETTRRARGAFTLRYHSPTVFGDRNQLGIREYTRRSAHQNVICSLSGKRTDNVSPFLSLYRRNADDQFSAGDARTTGRVLPHLLRALSINQQIAAGRISSIAGMTEGFAIVDDHGFVLYRSPSFSGHLKNASWNWTSPHLPLPVLEALAQSGEHRDGPTVLRAYRLGSFRFISARRRRAVDNLSPRERAVAEQLAQGRTHKQIAKHLGLSPATVRNHIQHVRDKLGAHTIGEVTAKLRQDSP
jgi:DNA-binding CsgD family transcriptional regulator